MEEVYVVITTRGAYGYPVGIYTTLEQARNHVELITKQHACVCAYYLNQELKLVRNLYDNGL